MKYKILYDYGTDGNIIDDGEFDTIDEAIKGAVSKNYCTKFRIITIAWDAVTPTNTDKTTEL